MTITSTYKFHNTTRQIFYSPCLLGNVGTTMSAENRRITIDAINYGVTLIKMRSRGEGPRQCDVGSATGFFFQDHNRKYLITNKHVVVGEREGFYPDNLLIRVHSSQESNAVNRDISIPLYGSDHRQLWLEHRDREVDRSIERKPFFRFQSGKFRSDFSTTSRIADLCRRW